MKQGSSSRDKLKLVLVNSLLMSENNRDFQSPGGAKIANYMVTSEEAGIDPSKIPKEIEL